VFTDGLDTSSRLTASEVSGIASSIDVPVYVIGIVPSIDNPSSATSLTTVEKSVFTGALSNLALDRRRDVRGVNDSGSHQDGAPRSWTSCGTSISSRSSPHGIRLASAHRPDARQGSHGSCS
jgi:hypothetical protein